MDSRNNVHAVEIRNRREESVPTFSSFCRLLARPRFFVRSAFSACSASIIALGVCGGVEGGRGGGGERGEAEKEGREDVSHVTNVY